MRESFEWRGRNVVAQEGTKVGRLEEVYLDQHTGRPEWLLVHTGLFGTKSSFAPLAGARVDGEDVRIGYSKQDVKRDLHPPAPTGPESWGAKATLIDTSRPGKTS